MMDYSRFLTPQSMKMEESILRKLVAKFDDAQGQFVSFAGGMPNPVNFPFKQCVIEMQDGSELKLDQKMMQTALQYGPTQGYTPFIKQLKKLTSRFHKPPISWNELDIAITSGAQDGLSKAIDMLVLPGDYVIVEEPCYIGALSMLQKYSPKYLPVKGDAFGMCPDALEAVLEKWRPEDIVSQKTGVPKLIYINTNASNPSGASLSTDRKNQIYQIAKKFNLLILEDDPYYLLRFNNSEDFSPSFLSLDTDGRVLRFDSLSKIFSPGMRVGYVTAHKDLIALLRLYIQNSILHASSLSQVLCSELLSSWSDDDFDKHIAKLQAFYKKRRDMMLEALEKYLKGLCEWSVPDGGMFLWLKIHGISDTWNFSIGKAMEKNVLVIPGKRFMTDQTAPCPYLRLAYSPASPEEIELGIKKLSEAIKEELSTGN